MIYTYFVSWKWYNGNETGFGNGDISTYSQITNMETVRQIENNVKSRNKFEIVIVLNWILLSTEKAPQ